jgi:hypothetical protein
MQFNGIIYSVAETTGPAFKWTVRFATRELGGVAPNRTLAKLYAVKAIEKDQRQTRAAIRKAEREK